MTSLSAALAAAQQAQAKGDYAAAIQNVKQFQEVWLNVEGEVKTRSVEDYRQTENDMALALVLLGQKSADATSVLQRMATRLQPYITSPSTNQYGVFDATLILLREGLEALLIIVALITFLKKSGNANKTGWVWMGAAAGIIASIALGVVIRLIFSSAINGGNREMIEGFTGLIAAAMLIYMSYWMHSKSNAEAWQKYIKQRSTAALATGSLSGLAVLAFLSIFREGGETALFFLGMASSISLSDLLTGLAIGTLALIVLGILLTVVGLRIPIAPFFGIASLVVFYICFKFVGMGLHALQLAKLIPTSSVAYLPASSFFGLFPTWETTLPQLT